ncbi:hypothetical protein [Chryseobacterium sp. WLY505]|uniref:hypothetical protein n=1 Tax=Chryseobacterium sp. WLY505 TaxID=3068892 RepID=UPI0027968C40|nr:hypothetical protein [Chryseobacterium sp. WLY505]MDQ1859014.1 hypothetical protein [Chryseobacterium sp. WLY505]
MNKIFRNSEYAYKYFKKIAEEKFKRILLKKGLDINNIENDNLEILKNKDEISTYLLNNSSLFQDDYITFNSPEDFEIANSGFEQTRFTFVLHSYLRSIHDLIQERINVLEQTNKVESIKNLVGNLPENDIKDKLKIEIEELEAKKRELQTIKDEEKEKLSDEIELGKHKTDMFVKKTDVFLKFLDRESVASIVGSLLLLTMGICLIVVMFRHEEPLKIIESAFLLILGYFFGHSKNNK